MGLANVASVHPSHYPFVRNGPACACADSRLAHVGNNKYGMPAADVGCSECELCDHYTPLEAVDRAAEELQRDELLAEQHRRTEIHRRITFVLLFPIMAMIPVAIWAPGFVPWLMAGVLSAGLANMATASIASWRVGDLDRDEAAMQTGMGVGIVGFFLALFLGATTFAYVLLGIALAFAFGFGFVTQRWLKRSMRSMSMLVADLKREQGDQP
jgi:hypothetical protein